MITPFDRRDLFLSALAALSGLAAAGLASGARADDDGTSQSGGGSEHEFDFFLGAWKVHHRRLKHQLVGSQDWEEFEGATRCVSLLGGMANINESITHRPHGTSYGLGLRGYDAKTGLWADWTIDPRRPASIDPPDVGRFVNGVAELFSDDTLDGKPIKVRGRFTPLGPTQCQWDQAFSADRGATWEMNWVMRYLRIG